jgi:hypothetical protein
MKYLRLFLFFIGFAALFAYVIWAFFLAYSGIQFAKATSRATPIVLFATTPIVVVGVALDFIGNVVLLTPIFFELPQELLMTKRFKRHKQSSGYRQHVAIAVCDNLLDPFDPGHCK